MRIARINQVSRASAFGVRARRMVAGLTAFATRSTLATLVVGAVGLFGAAPAAAQCWPSCGPVWWEDIPMGQRLTYYFPASRRGYFTGQMSVRGKPVPLILVVNRCFSNPAWHSFRSSFRLRARGIVHSRFRRRNTT